MEPNEKEELETAAAEETQATDSAAENGIKGAAQAEGGEEAKEAKEPSELEKATALAEDYKRKWYAVTAEYDNYRKRTAATASQKYAEGRSDIMVKLFPIGDNIDRALAVCNDENMKKGLEMVKTSLTSSLPTRASRDLTPRARNSIPRLPRRSRRSPPRRARQKAPSNRLF